MMRPRPTDQNAPLAGTHICKSCGHRHDGAFCSQCGQEVALQRLTVRSLVRRALSDFFDIERGFLHTAAELFRKPGEVVRDYIGGRTVRYMKPLRYFLVFMTAAHVVAWKTGVIEQLVRGFIDGFDSSGQRAGLSAEEITKFVAQNFVLLFAPAVLHLAAFLRKAFNRAGYNYAEWLLHSLYVSAQIMLIFVAVTPLAVLLPAGPEYVLSLLMLGAQVAYFTYATWRFTRQPLWRVALAAPLVLLLAFFVHSALLVALYAILS